MAARAVAARRPWQRLVPGASLPLPVPPRCRAPAGDFACPFAANPVALSLAAALWARPSRLQHEGQPEGQPERSDQVRLLHPAVPAVSPPQGTAVAGNASLRPLWGSGSSNPESTVGSAARTEVTRRCIQYLN